MLGTEGWKIVPLRLSAEEGRRNSYIWEVIQGVENRILELMLIGGRGPENRTWVVL